MGSFAPRAGAVVFAQRFGSALNLNLHFHALVLDGVYSRVPGKLAPRFHSALPLEYEHVSELATSLRRLVTRYLQIRSQGNSYRMLRARRQRRARSIR